MHGAKFLLIPLVAVALAGCASTPASHYYTLMPPAASKRDAAPASQASPPPGYVIDVQPVSVPEQLDRLQIVLNDTATTQVVILNNYLWASPLSQELRNALSDDLSGRLGVIDVSSSGPGGDAPSWKIALAVQRFESVYGRYALLDATWQLLPMNLKGGRKVLCRASARVPVEREGVSALVSAHQEALQRLSAVIAEQLRGGKAAAEGDGVELRGCSGL